MESKNSFVIYTSWRSFFELLEEPELIKELLYTMFDIAELENQRFVPEDIESLYDEEEMNKH